MVEIDLYVLSVKKIGAGGMKVFTVGMMIFRRKKQENNENNWWLRKRKDKR